MECVVGILFHLGGNTDRFWMWGVAVQILPEELEVLELPFFKTGKDVDRPAFGRESWSSILDRLNLRFPLNIQVNLSCLQLDIYSLIWTIQLGFIRI